MMPPNLLRLLLLPDARLFGLALLYGLVVSLLTLAVPFSVQVLVETVANTGVLQPILVLSFVLFGLLLLYGLMNALQLYVVELFERRFFARAAGEIALRALYARHEYLESVNREELFNRYFDVLTVKKNVPLLLTSGVALLFQMIVGFAVVAMYHPTFLVFSLAYMGCALIVWRIFHGSALLSAQRNSSAKYRVAAWLETLAGQNLFFKARPHLEYGIERAREEIDTYVETQREHFHHTFAQAVGFLLLYALGSAGLLGLGGWLVVVGQITLGQLVAAELILAAVFYGVTSFSYFLKLYYELVASIQKVGYLFVIPIEPTRAVEPPADLGGEVDFRGVRGELRGMEFSLGFHIDSGRLVLLAATTSVLVKVCRDFLLALRECHSGSVRIGGMCVQDVAPDALRARVLVIDAATIPDTTIANFLALARADVSRSEMREYLELAGLTATVDGLDHGLDEPLLADGHPLTTSETLRLRLVHALLARPKVLLILPILDMVHVVHREHLLERLREEAGTTVLYFSNRRDLRQMDDYWLVAPTRQERVETLDALCDLEAAWIQSREAGDHLREPGAAATQEA